MKISHIALAAGLVLGSAAAVASPGPLDLSTGSTNFGNTPVAGGFTDVYTFTVVQASSFIASFTSVVNGGQDVDFTSFSLSGPSGTFFGTQLLPDPVEVYSLNVGNIAAGAYQLTVTGINSAAVGSYGGSVAVAAPVPEPQTYALMLAGLGVMGFVARRRRA
ncbi:hypothetical protein BH11PSE9_BH11PSE9_31570 [soil metagenome]